MSNVEGYAKQRQTNELYAQYEENFCCKGIGR